MKYGLSLSFKHCRHRGSLTLTGVSLIGAGDVVLICDFSDFSDANDCNDPRSTVSGELCTSPNVSGTLLVFVDCLNFFIGCHGAEGGTCSSLFRNPRALVPPSSCCVLADDLLFVCNLFEEATLFVDTCLLPSNVNIFESLLGISMLYLSRCTVLPLQL